ncbi:MAG: threonine synthase, partial [Eggerthellaceae bacterium]|nr:threonine synthase [Eggerthellaceae bacterium]
MAQNLYIDTRGLHGAPITFTEAVVCGQAGGGGLFVPKELPELPLGEILALADAPYAQRAARIYQAFGVDLPESSITALMERAYGANFDTPDICPIIPLDAQTYMLELWHGPTCAFKDLALQCLPHFFTASAKQLAEQGKLAYSHLILVATSGDTGKAALEGFKDKEGIRIGVFYPRGGVSDIQFKQMATQAGENVMVWGVEGNFDDCQGAVKAIFNDEGFAKTLLAEKNCALSSANSINWGRLLPQVVYYVSSYAALVHAGRIAPGRPIDVCVPTGNFGNILAAWYAKRIGTPIDMLLCASNENRVLTDFINTGTY